MDEPLLYQEEIHATNKTIDTSRKKFIKIYLRFVNHRGLMNQNRVYGHKV